jgi:hypothetical protein
MVYGYYGNARRPTAAKYTNAKGRTGCRLEPSLVTVPARVNTILEITTTVGATEACEAVEVAELCTARAVTTPDEVAGAEVKQYIYPNCSFARHFLRVSECLVAYE